jgi:ABC-type siderophore export system fused ATPase/permease subunit
VNVVHFVLLLDLVGGAARSIFCCICYLNLIRMLSGKLLLLAISSMVVHSLSWFSLLRGRLNILSM